MTHRNGDELVALVYFQTIKIENHNKINPFFFLRYFEHWTCCSNLPLALVALVAKVTKAVAIIAASCKLTAGRHKHVRVRKNIPAGSDLCIPFSFSFFLSLFACLLIGYAKRRDIREASSIVHINGRIVPRLPIPIRQGTTIREPYFQAFHSSEKKTLKLSRWRENGSS